MLLSIWSNIVYYIHFAANYFMKYFESKIQFLTCCLAKHLELPCNETDCTNLYCYQKLLDLVAWLWVEILFWIRIAPCLFDTLHVYIMLVYALHGDWSWLSLYMVVVIKLMYINNYSYHFECLHPTCLRSPSCTRLQKLITVAQS